MSSASPVISFARGVPSPDLVPVAEIALAAQRALADDATGALAYGDAAGYAPLRNVVADRYATIAQAVLLTNGSLQGLAFLAETLFAGSGGRVMIEAPTYDRAIVVLRRFGAQIDAVALEQDGLDVEAVEAACRRERPPGLVYTIPTFQNPGGVTLSAAKRDRLVELAQRYGFLVFEDDPYGELRFDGEPQTTLWSRDGGDHVVYSTSFTKTIGPGLRTGALILPPPLHERLRRLALDTYISPCTLAQAVVYQYCAAGAFEPGLRAATSALRTRRDTMINAVRRHFGQRAQFVTPAGGYFLWLTLPGVDTDALAREADQAGVPVVAGSGCFVPADDADDAPGRDAVRLAFSASDPASIEEGIARLAALPAALT